MGAKTLDLSENQYQLLTVLVNVYQNRNSFISTTTIAEIQNRHPNTIRDSMAQLRSLGLVVSKSGPSGGYIPTKRAFQLLDRDSVSEREYTTISQDVHRITVALENIRFTNVQHPTECRAWITFQMALPDVDVGDAVIVGPTPETQLGIAGHVHAITDTRDRLLLTVTKIEAPLNDQ